MVAAIQGRQNDIGSPYSALLKYTDQAFRGSSWRFPRCGLIGLQRLLFQGWEEPVHKPERTSAEVKYNTKLLGQHSQPSGG